MILQDREARDRARLSLSDNIVVEAGAGTGKTTLLIDRLVFLLLAGGPKKEGLDITRLVALTFTKKAAAEIRARLAGILNDLLAHLEEKPLPSARRGRAEALLADVEENFGAPRPRLRERAEAALRDMDRSHIGTIDHFASTILRLYPVESGLGPGFEVDEGERFEDLFESEWALWLDGELGTNPPRRAPWLDLLGRAPLEDVETLARVFSSETLRQGKPGATAEMKEEIKNIARAVEGLGALPDPGGRGKIRESISEITGHLAALLGVLDGGRPDAAAVTPEFKSRDWPKLWKDLPGEDVYLKALAFCQKTSPEGELDLRRAEALVRPFGDAFRDKFLRKGYVSFAGLLTRARDLVRDNPGPRRALKARFDALLIDEFQDTDPLQGEILLYLAEEVGSAAADWRDIRLEKGKIFVVGDPKQSIYRFRGADIAAYAQFTELLSAQGALKCHLQTNFRSHEGLVAPINAVFEKLMTAREGLQPAYVPLHPRPEAKPVDGKDALEWALVAPAEGEKDVKAPEGQREEARWAARWVQTHCPKEFHYRDVAFLLRSTSPLSVYLEALKEAGIPYVVESDRYFYGAQEVIDFINLMKALDDPRDAVSFLGLLRSPLVALEDRDILGLGLADGFTYLKDPPPSSDLSPAARKRLGAFSEMMRRFREKVGKVPLGDFVDDILRESLLLELCSAADEREQTASNLLKFGRMAREAGEKRGMTLKEFIGQAARSADGAREEGESPLADDMFDAVRILTVHKAKGLEFKVVFLPNLSSPKGGRGEKPASLLDWGRGALGLRLPRAGRADAAMALLETAEKEREEAEQVRLLYVAMTRAREKLILLGRDTARDKHSFARLLTDAGAWPALSRGERACGGPKGAEIPQDISLANRAFPVTLIESGKGDALTRKPESFRGPKDFDARALARLWTKRREECREREDAPLFTSPTALQKTASPARPRLPSNRDLISSPHGGEDSGEGPQSSASLLGTLCHAVLERWDFAASPAGLDAALSRARAVLSRREPRADWDFLVQMARKILETFLASAPARALASAEILGREVPFLRPLDGQVMRGKIDVLFREKGRLWVADFKTDTLAPGEAPRRARDYALQGQAYAAAVEKALGEPCRFRLIFLRTGESVDAAPAKY